MRRQRLLFLFTICAILVTMAILGSASWMIVKQHTETPAYPVKPDTSPYFTTEYTYDGSTTFVPELNEDGIAIFGEDAEFEITYVTGKTFEASYNSGTYNSLADAENAGNHYFKITEATTGQVIANCHLVTVNKANVTLSTAVSSVTNNGSANSNLASLSAGFIGDTVTWTISINGVSGDGVLGTASVSYELLASDFDTFSSSIQDSSNTGSIDYSVSANDVSNKKHKNNYTISGSGTVTCGVLPTCYSTDGTTKTYYGNLDQALEATITSNVTLVPPVSLTIGDYTFSVKTNFNHTITKDSIIGANVKFVIPYDNSDTAVTSPTAITGKSASAFGVLSKQKNVVTVSASVTLTANGTIHIPGEVTGSQNGQNGASLTTGSHSQLTLGANAKIDAYNNVYCYGFIAEETLDNGSGITMNKGNITTVYTVVEHRGGTIFLDMIGGIFSVRNPNLQTAPFNRFYIRSVTASLMVTDNATVTAYADLHANDQHNITNVSLVGSTSSSLIQLSSGSKLITKYRTDTNQNTLDIYGNATINSLALTVKAMGISVTLSTEKVLFPISHYWNISLHAYEDGGSAVVTSPSQDIKILPGGSLTIGEGVTFNVDTLAVYPANDDPKASEYANLKVVVDGSTNSVYPYENVSAGVLNVAGTLNATNFGGAVNASESGSTINITNASVDSKELQTTNDCVYRTIELTANGVIATKNAEGQVESSGQGNLSAGTYLGFNFINTTNYGWIDSSTEFGLNYAFTGIDSEANAITNSNPTKYTLLGTITLNIPTIEAPTPQFAGWFPNTNYDPDDQVFSITGAELLALSNGDATLYGKWTETAYTLSFNTSTNTGNITEANVTIPNITVGAGTNFNPYTNVQINDIVKIYRDDITSNRYFDGWYTDSAFTNKVSETDGLTVSSNVTLYAKWTDKVSITFDVPSGAGYTIPTIYLEAGSLFNPYAYDVEYIVKSNAYTCQYYFIAWYLDAEYANEISITDGISVEENTQLYAKWDKKYSITFSVGDNGGYTIPTIYVAPGTLFSPYTYDTQGAENSTDPKKQYYLEGWYNDGNRIDEGGVLTINSDTTLTSKYSAKPYSIKMEISGVVISVSGVADTFEKNTTLYFRYETTVTLTATKTKDEWSGTEGWTQVGDTYIKEVTVGPDSASQTVRISASCIAAGTMITLADGTTKAVEDLLETDILLVYDHEKGMFVECPILFIERDGWANYDIINLEFSDGTVTRLIYEHALFDVTLNKYVYITADNLNDFIGHEFAQANGETIETVTLVNAYMTNEYTGCFSLVTYYHLNYFIDGMFSIPGGIDGIFNVFEYDENLKYDEEQMQKDIETYGLYTYEDFAEYIPKEVFDMFQTPYFKVAVGKGHITYEGILELIEKYLVKHGFI